MYLITLRPLSDNSLLKLSLSRQNGKTYVVSREVTIPIDKPKNKKEAPHFRPFKWVSDVKGFFVSATGLMLYNSYNSHNVAVSDYEEIRKGLSHLKYIEE